MRIFLSMFVVCGLASSAACETAEADPGISTEVQNLGLPVQMMGGQAITPGDVVVPPLGEGVAPILGFPGDGAAVVTAVGGWGAGPGAVRWHGGQWVIPYVGKPGASIANVSCDVKPNATASDLIELVGPSGVIGSVTVDPTTVNVIIRAWILPTNYTIPDGGNVVIRHSARDAATGQWTGASADLTVISCAVNAMPVRTIVVPVVPPQTLSPLVGRWVSVGGQGSASLWEYVQLPTITGSTIMAIRARVQDAGSGTTLRERLMSQSDGGQGLFAVVATSAPSGGFGQEETLTIPGPIVATAGTSYTLEVGNGSNAANLNSKLFRIELDVR